jgi:plasmid stabilization system protein ParE
MAELQILDHADQDLDELLDYLEREAGDAVVEALVSSFKTQFQVLCTFPRIGAPRPRLGHRMRLWQVDSYNVYYELNEDLDRVVIFRILHSRRNIKRSMLKR